MIATIAMIPTTAVIAAIAEIELKSISAIVVAAIVRSLEPVVSIIIIAAIATIAELFFSAIAAIVAIIWKPGLMDLVYCIGRDKIFLVRDRIRPDFFSFRFFLFCEGVVMFCVILGGFARSSMQGHRSFLSLYSCRFDDNHCGYRCLPPSPTKQCWGECGLSKC